MPFGKTVRKLREADGLTIAQLSRKVGMSPTYLAPVEREVFLPPAEGKVVRRHTASRFVGWTARKLQRARFLIKMN